MRSSLPSNNIGVRIELTFFIARNFSWQRWICSRKQGGWTAVIGQLKVIHHVVTLPPRKYPELPTEVPLRLKKRDPLLFARDST